MLVSGEAMLIFSFFQNEHNSNLNNFSYVGTVHLFPKIDCRSGTAGGKYKIRIKQ